MIFFFAVGNEKAPLSSKSKPAVSLGLRKTTQARAEVRSPPKHLLWSLCQFVAASDISKWSDCSVLGNLTGEDGHLHRAIHSNISNTSFGKNTSPGFKSLSINHVGLSSSFSLSVYQTWFDGPPSHPATAQKLLSPAHSPSFFPIIPFSALFPTLLVIPEFARDRELCWSGLWLIIGPFGLFHILTSLMWH